MVPIDDVSRPPIHRDKSTSERADLSLLISPPRDETIRQLNIQNSVLQKQFKSLFTPSLHVALDLVRINSTGVPLSKYPLSERIRDTLAIATLSIGYYDYVLLQISELTVFRRHTWLRQEYLATAAQEPSAIEDNILMAQGSLLHDLPSTQDVLRVPVEPATLFVGRDKSRWSVINPPIKAPCTPTKTYRASTTTRSVPGPESVRRFDPKHRPLGCRRTRSNGWLATHASSKGEPQSLRRLAPLIRPEISGPLLRYAPRK